MRSDVEVVKEVESNPEILYPKLQASLQKIFKEISFQSSNSQESVSDVQKIFKSIQDVPRLVKSDEEEYVVPIWQIDYEEIKKSEIKAWTYSSKVN